MIAPPHKMLYKVCALLTLLTLGFTVGCKSYKLGHPAELPFETIFIQPAKNDSFAPQAQALVSSEVREAVIRDGRVKLIANRSEADAVLMLTLTDYSRRAATRSQDDTEVAQDFDLTLQLQLDLFDQRSGEYLFQERRVQARSKAYVYDPYAGAGAANTQGLIQSEFNAIPRLARDLGRKAADELLSVW
ncbi:LPS assembly lipoprotein LptE [Coraliomargarita sinensis]|nr:LPS assembly lipoprotein LptE [Coraliomargarita sinensis]